LENTIRASLGDENARQYVIAADDTTDNAGLVPTRQLTEVINGLGNIRREAIASISSGVLPDAGMTFEIPKITVMPTVAVTAEGTAPSETDQNSAFLTVDVKKYAGQQTFSVELLDRTSPLFFNELLTNMSKAYAKATNTAVQIEIMTDGTKQTTALANTAGDFLKFVATGAAAVYAGTQDFASSLLVTSAQWANIMGYNDGGRPIYTASQPSNAGGSVSPQSVRGNVAGLNLYVSDAAGYGGDGDLTMAVINPSSFTWYESPTYRLRADVIANGQVSVAVYGYGAIATKIGAGASTFNFT
jgi:HK97 family phage major capsid protein